MPSKARRTKLVALPIHVIQIPDGVILKRGATEVMITGANATEAIRMVLDATGRDGASVGEIRRLFRRTSGVQVDTILSNLDSRRLLVPKNGQASSVNGQESPLDIFFWQFGGTLTGVLEQLNKVRLVIIGVNYISRQLAASLMSCAHKNFTVMDHPRYRNLYMFNKAGKLKQGQWPASVDSPQDWKDSQQSDLGDCLIVTSDFGGRQALCEWNTLCLDQKVHFMPVVLKNMVGYVGPMVIPGETACYECLVSRQRSHSANPEAEFLTDNVAFEGQAVVGFHPSMAAILGDIAAFELTRFYGSVLPEKKAGRLLEVNLLAASMTGRTVLKVPRCAACSPLHKTSQPNLSKAPLSEWVKEWVKVQ